MALSGPDIRPSRCPPLGQSRLDLCTPSLQDRPQTWAFKTTRLRNMGRDNMADLASLWESALSFLKSHFRLQEQERFHSRTCPTDRPLVCCPCRLSESFRSGR